MLILKVFKIIVNIEQNIVIELSKIYYENEAICIKGSKMKLLNLIGYSGSKFSDLCAVTLFTYMSINCICQRVFISFFDKTHENKVHVLMKNTESRDIQSLIVICSQRMET